MASPARLLPGPFTVETYHRLGELGIFDEDDRVELLDGQIVEMTPIGRDHAGAVFRLTNLFARRTTGDVGVSVQNPLALNPRWEPQPDIVLVRRPEGFAGGWLPSPKDAILVVEVADTSLERDRDLKIPRYARDGIPETWLVDVNARTVTAYRDPHPRGYRDVSVLKGNQILRPVEWPGLEITADEILG